MADSGLFIGFGFPARGRERQSIKVFNEVFEYYSRLQQEGEIESFEPVLPEAHGGEPGGFSCSAANGTSSRAFAAARSSNAIPCGASSSSTTSASWARPSAIGSYPRWQCSPSRSKN